MLREFEDADGVHWRVWDVKASHARASLARANAFSNVPDGWLAFEAAGQRRRLHPIPPDWEIADSFALARYCATAEPVRPPDSPRAGNVIG